MNCTLSAMLKHMKLYMQMFSSFGKYCKLTIFISFNVYCLALCQIRDPNLNRGVPNPRVAFPYPNNYYERYAPNDRFPPYSTNRERADFMKTGLDSIYGDSRCLNDGYKEEKEKTVTVTTHLGTVEGSYIYLCDGPGVPEFNRPPNVGSINRRKIYRNLTIFLGIPYAKPHSKENEFRFKPPQFLPTFNLIRALRYKNACPQPPAYYGVNKGVPETSEDCLYLNVFSPSVAERSQNEKYPVMIYIHGGDWIHGSANIFPAQMLAASQEVIVVTFNYRLGPLGFFATADNASAGNYGLLDQAMAIEWVYDNIDRFNGNPKLITLFGPGAGAASAGIHILTKRLRGKIKRVIAQSGSAVARWASISDPTIIYNNSMKFARMLNCNFASKWRIVDCLRDLSVSTLQVTNLKPDVGWLPWGPVVDAYTREVDKAVLPNSPEKLLEYGYFNNLDGYMAGVTKDEALLMLLEETKFKSNNYQITKDLFLEEIKKFPVMYNFTLDPESLVKAISFMYLPCDHNSENLTLLRQNYIDMLSDSYFKAPNDKMIKLLLERGVKTYMYVLNTTAEGLRKSKDHSMDIFNTSVPHNSEYYFITGAPFMDPKLYPSDFQLQKVEWTEGDRNMSQFFMTALANFAKFGNPTPSALFENILWMKTDLNHMQYLSINTTNFTSLMMDGYRQKESQFWNLYVPDLMQLILPTWPPTYQPWEVQRNIYEASLWGVLGATLLFIFLTFLCCFLYCKTKSKHIVSTEDIPDAISTTPSSIDTLLNMKKMDSRNHYLSQKMEMEQKHTQV